MVNTKSKFNDQKYIELALSKDIGRGALEYAYRDKDKLVGCDGHRLHMICGLPQVKESYLVSCGSYDGQYPQYELALPDKERFISNIIVEKRDMKRIKGLSEFIGVEENPVAALHTEGNMLHITHINPAESVQARLVIELENTPRIPMERMGVDLRYFYQALIQDAEMELYQAEGRGIVLKCQLPSINSYALIMAAAVSL